MFSGIAKQLRKLARVAEALADSDEEWETVAELPDKGRAEVLPAPSSAASSGEPPAAETQGRCKARAAAAGGRGAGGGYGVAEHAAVEVPASAVTYHSDVRFYVVAQNPLNEWTTGIWFGKGDKVWKKLEATLRDGKLAGSGARLRRVKTMEEAKLVWLQAAERYGMCLEPPMHPVA